ncbi:MAG: type II secretion system protein GspM [Henriciella sp.]|jgi:general secretion pathway protein M
MKTWWSGLAARERYLMVCAAALLAVVVLFQFLLLPLYSTRSDMQADLERAGRKLERVETAYFQLRAAGVSQAGVTGPAMNVDRFKAELTQSAREKGLGISRLQDSGGRVGLTIDRGDPRLVFFWLEDLETRLGAKISRLSLEQAGGDFVRVTVEFEAGGS